MKVILCFKQLQLGELSYQNGVYQYNSNVNDEKKFENYLNFANYKLFASRGRTSRTLEEPFATIVKDIRLRPDLLGLCLLTSNSSDFEVLCEYAKTNQFNQGYHLIYKD